jgi:hypothetical protein
MLVFPRRSGGRVGQIQYPQDIRAALGQYPDDAISV